MDYIVLIVTVIAMAIVALIKEICDSTDAHRRRALEACRLLVMGQNEAHQWFQNGDQPLDYYEKGTADEGKLVRRYRVPDLDGQNICCNCGYLMHDHGWIDISEHGHVVCPDRKK